MADGKRPQPSRPERDGGLSATFFDALDLIGGHSCPLGEAGDAQAEGDPPVIQCLAEG
jgi:hypothetical protein